jgi:hypothetical protein
MTGPAVNLTRRQFGKAAGALVLSFALAPRLAGAQAPKLPGSLANNRMLDAWLRINPDGSVIIFTGKVELGQGILTALAQIAAEELDLPLVRVRMIAGDTAQTPDEDYTSGSQSIEYGGTAVRLACAEARALLVDQAAKRLGMPADAFKVSEGVVTAPDGRKLGYGELAAELDLDREVTATVAPKPPAQHTIVGRSVPRRDIPAKVTGGAAYVQDLRLSRMVHGRVVRPPHYGARLDALDEAPRNAGGDRGGARWEFSRRRRRTRGAGDQGAQGADRRSQVDWRLRAARSRTAPRAAHGVADAILGGQREAGGGCNGRENPRSGLHQALYRARLDWPLLRGRRVQRRWADGVDPFAGCLPAPARPR